jgi:hypothetical protein
MAGTIAYLGGIEINVNGLYLGQDYAELNPFTPPIPPVIPTGSVQMYFDSADWNGISSTLLGRYANATASLTNVTVGVSSSLNFTTASNLITTASGIQPVQATTSTVFAIYASSGSATDPHGRLLNSAGTNWLFGTYGGKTPPDLTEIQYAWFNNQFVIGSGSYDTNWHMMTGIRHSATSASVYIDNVYKTGSLQSNNGFNGLAVNFPIASPDETTQANIGVFAVYNRELSPTEINEIYNNYKTKYGL